MPRYGYKHVLRMASVSVHFHPSVVAAQLPASFGLFPVAMSLAIHARVMARKSERARRTHLPTLPSSIPAPAPLLILFFLPPHPPPCPPFSPSSSPSTPSHRARTRAEYSCHSRILTLPTCRLISDREQSLALSNPRYLTRTHSHHSLRFLAVCRCSSYRCRPVWLPFGSDPIKYHPLAVSVCSVIR